LLSWVQSVLPLSVLKTHVHLRVDFMFFNIFGSLNLGIWDHAVVCSLVAYFISENRFISRINIPCVGSNQFLTGPSSKTLIQLLSLLYHQTTLEGLLGCIDGFELNIALSLAELPFGSANWWCIYWSSKKVGLEQIVLIVNLHRYLLSKWSFKWANNF
jgi:hypothetical protein